MKDAHLIFLELLFDSDSQIPSVSWFPLHLQDPSLAIFALLSPQFCSILPPKPGFSPRLAHSLCLMSIRQMLIISTNPGYLLTAENTVYG